MSTPHEFGHGDHESARCRESDAILSHYLDGHYSVGHPSDGPASASCDSVVPCNADGESLARHLADCKICANRLEAARRLDAVLAVEAGGLAPLDTETETEWFDAALKQRVARDLPAAHSQPAAQCHPAAHRQPAGPLDEFGPRNARSGTVGLRVAGVAAAVALVAIGAWSSFERDPGIESTSSGRMAMDVGRPAGAHPELVRRSLDRAVGPPPSTAAADRTQARVTGIRTIDLPDDLPTSSRRNGGPTARRQPSRLGVGHVSSATLAQHVLNPDHGWHANVGSRLALWAGSGGSVYALLPSTTAGGATPAIEVRRRLFEQLLQRRDAFRWSTARTLLEQSRSENAFDPALVQRAASALRSSPHRIAAIRTELTGLAPRIGEDRYHCLLLAARLAHTKLDREVIRAVRCDFRTARRLAQDLWGTRAARGTTDFLLQVWSTLRVRCTGPLPDPTARGPAARGPAARDAAQAAPDPSSDGLPSTNAQRLLALDRECANGFFGPVALDAFLGSANAHPSDTGSRSTDPGWDATRPNPVTAHLLAIARHAPRHSDRRLALLALAEWADPAAVTPLLRLATGSARSLVDEAAFALGRSAVRRPAARDALWRAADRRRTDRARLVAALLVARCERARRFQAARGAGTRAAAQETRAGRTRSAQWPPVAPQNWRFEDFVTARVALERILSRGASPPP